MIWCYVVIVLVVVLLLCFYKSIILSIHRQFNRQHVYWMHELHVNSVYVWGGAAGGRFFNPKTSIFWGTLPGNQALRQQRLRMSKVWRFRYTTKVNTTHQQLNILRKNFQNTWEGFPKFLWEGWCLEDMFLLGWLCWSFLRLNHCDYDLTPCIHNQFVPSHLRLRFIQWDPFLFSCLSHRVNQTQQTDALVCL